MRALDTPEALIAQVRLVDDAYRDFSVDPAEAAANYGIRGELMTELLDRGLPVRGGPDGPRLDGYDLANIALHLGLSSMQRRAVVAWRQTLLAGTALPVARYVLAYAGECARPGHAGPCGSCAAIS